MRHVAEFISGLEAGFLGSYEQTALGAQTWLEVACIAYLCGQLLVVPT
jgi:hypothetical protein